MSTEFWMMARPQVGETAAFARHMESLNVWDGFALTDSQHLNGDTYCSLAIAAHVTKRIGLGTGVTNPITRNPAITASASSTIQIESGGRMILGIGRGDSALGHLGLRPAPVTVFEGYVTKLQRYLRGEAVEQNGHEAHIRWMAQVPKKVPVDITATGPKMIAVAGRLGDWVSFAVGANPERLQQSIQWVRESQEKAKREKDELRLGAYMVVGAHPDPVVARGVCLGSIASLAHFSSMHGKNVDGVAEEDANIIANIGKTYDLQFHGDVRGGHVQHMDDAFINRYAVIGKPSHCVERLQEILDAVPLERIVFTNRSRGADEQAADEVRACLAEDVLPALRK